MLVTLLLPGLDYYQFMPRKPRFFLPDVPNHVVQRGRNRDPIFFESSDYYFYLDKLRDALDKYDVSLHAYVLMTNPYIY